MARLEFELIYFEAAFSTLAITQLGHPLIIHGILTIFHVRTSDNTRIAGDQFDLAFFVYRHINLHGLFNAKTILIEEQQWYSLTYSWGIRGFIPFPGVLFWMLTVQQEFELAYFNVTDQHFTHYATGTPTKVILVQLIHGIQTIFHVRNLDNTRKAGEWNTTKMRILVQIIHGIMTILHARIPDSALNWNSPLWSQSNAGYSWCT